MKPIYVWTMIVLAAGALLAGCSSSPGGPSNQEGVDQVNKELPKTAEQMPPPPTREDGGGGLGGGKKPGP